MKKLNVLSLFDGISCGQIALERAKIPVNQYFASEIDKHAIKVTQHNWPDTIQLGDINNWRDWNIDWTSIDLILAGSPCQGFSFCGKQLNFEDPRSRLFFVFIDILRYLRDKNPEIKFLLENVKMKEEYRNVISQAVGAEPIKINSALVSAQKRNRLYWTNIPNITQPHDKGILLKDILENPELVKVDREKSLSLNASYKSVPFRHYKEKKVNQMLLYRLPHGYITEDYYYVDKYPTLCAQSPGTKHKLVCGEHYRTLTPIECERLQTVPDDYTSVIAKTNRYKALGNGWTVDVMAHIFSFLKNNP